MTNAHRGYTVASATRTLGTLPLTSLSAGANVKAVQRMLGHASAAMTLDLCADLFDDDLEAAAARLDVLREAARVARSLRGAPDATTSPNPETTTGPGNRGL